MKRLLCYSVLIIGLILLCQDTTHAQYKKPVGKTGIGATAGVNLANVNGADFDTDIRTAFHLGIFYQLILLGGPLHLQTGLLYSQQGWKEGDITTKLNYINLNILLAYYLANTGPIKPFVRGGPNIGFNTSAKRDFAGNEIDISDGVNSVSLGALLEVGILINQLEVAVAINQGLNPVFDSESSNAKNWLIDAGVTFWF